MKPPRPRAARPPAGRAPLRLKSDADLRALQRLMLRAITRPLTADDLLAPEWEGGRRTAEIAATFIKPNDRLSAFERLQIYARCYWFRVIDAAYDDAPGLRALLGEEKFSALIRAYLAKYPSRSFSLRNLCARLPQFIAEEPQWTAPRTALALAMARFEWAQTVAFDGASRPILTRSELARTPPERLRLGLQPYLSLLRLEWPLDDYVLAVKKPGVLRGETSNVVASGPRRKARRAVPVPSRRRIHLVVHRFEHRLFYKRIEAPAFRILRALAAGKTLSVAVEAAGGAVTPKQAQEWFATWMELGWLCRAPAARKASAPAPE